MYGVLEVEEFSDAGEKLIEFAEKPQGSIHDFEQIFLDKISTFDVEEVSKLPSSNVKYAKILGINVPKKIKTILFL